MLIPCIDAYSGYLFPSSPPPALTGRWRAASVMRTSAPTGSPSSRRWVGGRVDVHAGDWERMRRLRECGLSLQARVPAHTRTPHPHAHAHSANPFSPDNTLLILTHTTTPACMQLDMEMAWMGRDEVMALMEGLVAAVFREVAGVELAPGPLRRLTYAEAMGRYASGGWPGRKYGDDWSGGMPDVACGLTMCCLLLLCPPTTTRP